MHKAVLCLKWYIQDQKAVVLRFLGSRILIRGIAVGYSMGRNADVVYFEWLLFRSLLEPISS